MRQDGDKLAVSFALNLCLFLKGSDWVSLFVDLRTPITSLPVIDIMSVTIALVLSQTA